MQISKHAHIGPGVTIGKNVTIGPGAVILGPTTIEDNVWIGPGTQIGAPPEITGHPHPAAWTGNLTGAGIHIEKNTTIRECVIIHQGSHRPTRIGTGTWILNRSYIAHDTQIGAHTTLSAGTSIGGHCEIDQHANIGMNAVIHQRRIIGAGAMIGMGTPITRDIPPYAKTYGTPPRLTGINTIGLTRNGHTQQTANALKHLYQTSIPTAETQQPQLQTQLENELATLKTALNWWLNHKNLNPVRPAN